MDLPIFYFHKSVFDDAVEALLKKTSNSSTKLLLNITLASVRIRSRFGHIMFWTPIQTHNEIRTKYFSFGLIQTLMGKQVILPDCGYQGSNSDDGVLSCAEKLNTQKPEFVKVVVDEKEHGRIMTYAKKMGYKVEVIPTTSCLEEVSKINQEIIKLFVPESIKK